MSVKSSSFENLSEKIYKKLKKSGVAPRIGKESAEFLSGVIEYLVAEMLDIAGEIAISKFCTVIEHGHIRKTIDEDHEFSILLRNTSIRDVLIKNRNEKAKNEEKENMSISIN